MFAHGNRAELSGCFAGERFDNARIDTLFLSMPRGILRPILTGCRDEIVTNRDDGEPMHESRAPEIDRALLGC